jgi:hypothetical protein
LVWTAPDDWTFSAPIDVVPTLRAVDSNRGVNAPII